VELLLTSERLQQMTKAGEESLCVGHIDTTIQPSFLYFFECRGPPYSSFPPQLHQIHVSSVSQITLHRHLQYLLNKYYCLMVNDLLSFGIPKISFPVHLADFLLDSACPVRISIISAYYWLIPCFC